MPTVPTPEEWAANLAKRPQGQIGQMATILQEGVFLGQVGHICSLQPLQSVPGWVETYLYTLELGNLSRHDFPEEALAFGVAQRETAISHAQFWLLLDVAYLNKKDSEPPGAFLARLFLPPAEATDSALVRVGILYEWGRAWVRAREAFLDRLAHPPTESEPTP